MCKSEMHCDSQISMLDKPWTTFLVVRLSSLLLVQTWFVADEYWQATEIAHHMAFGYGYKTWEWQQGLRSALYPAVLGGLYKMLAVVNLDHPFLLIHLPRLFHAVMFSIGDYHIWKLSNKLYNKSASYWTVICLISSWFLEYCAPRTLTSCVEMVLSSIALYHYPWRKQRDDCSIGYMWLIGSACIIRPTAAVLFLPLCLQHLWMSQHRLKLLAKYVVTLMTVLGLTVVLDSWYYDRLIIVPWNFAHFNVVSGLASHYGTHPWHWYLTHGIPVTLATHLIPCLLAIWKYPSRHKELLLLVMWSTFCYSCLSHKEFRFLLPLLPLCMCIAGDFIAFALSSQVKKTDTTVACRSVFVMLFLMLPNFFALIYLGMVHQRGPLDTMTVLRQDIDKHKTPSILFLMPCHSTPYFSHMHRNVFMRFLTCEPNFTYEENYLDEADIFERDPGAWLSQQYGHYGGNDSKRSNNERVKTDGKLSYTEQDGRAKFSNIALPTHLVLFDVLVRKIEEFLKEHNYHLKYTLFHSHVEDGRRGRYIIIYTR